MNQYAAGLGDGGVQQVGTDRRRRVDAEPKQDRGHERPATYASHADDEADNQPGNDQPDVH
ncbi:hypothetical protein D3C87_1923390 [compost metagenome]